jgi:hypothetical protein
VRGGKARLRGWRARCPRSAARHQPALDAFLANPSASAARSALLAAPHFTDPWRDGRDSEAIVTLLADLHGWRRAGLPITVLAFDVDDASWVVRRARRRWPSGSPGRSSGSREPP